MTGKYNGNLIGYRTYAKDGKNYHMYDVFCEGQKDTATGLYSTECTIVTIREEHEAITPLVFNMPVEFYGETKQSKNGTYIAYSGIKGVKNGVK